MQKQNLIKKTALLVAAVSATTLSGCATYEVNTGRGNIPGYWIRYEMQEADRAIEAARAAGKDKLCPEQFREAEKAKDDAYDVFRACHTEEGSALAKQATAKANALCPPAPVAVAPALPVEPAPAAPVPPPAPTNWLTVNPISVISGEKATLNWSSKNATQCGMEPGIGNVPLQGSLQVTPVNDTSFNLLCSGPGGSATSTTSITVKQPAAVEPPAAAVAAPVATPAMKLCRPAVIDINFDTNKSDIKPQYHDELKQLADFLKEFPNARGVIEGHTDNVGGREFNMKLSQRRADSVRSYLINKFGIAPERIKAVGYGPTKPIADNSTKAGKERNRRIESNFSCD